MAVNLEILSSPLSVSMQNNTASLLNALQHVSEQPLNTKSVSTLAMASLTLDRHGKTSMLTGICLQVQNSLLPNFFENNEHGVVAYYKLCRTAMRSSLKDRDYDSCLLIYNNSLSLPSISESRTVKAFKFEMQTLYYQAVLNTEAEDLGTKSNSSFLLEIKSGLIKDAHLRPGRYVKAVFELVDVMIEHQKLELASELIDSCYDVLQEAKSFKSKARNILFERCFRLRAILAQSEDNTDLVKHCFLKACRFARKIQTFGDVPEGFIKPIIDLLPEFSADLEKVEGNRVLPTLLINDPFDRIIEVIHFVHCFSYDRGFVNYYLSELDELFKVNIPSNIYNLTHENSFGDNTHINNEINAKLFYSSDFSFEDYGKQILSEFRRLNSKQPNSIKGLLQLYAYRLDLEYKFNLPKKFLDTEDLRPFEAIIARALSLSVVQPQKDRVSYICTWLIRLSDLYRRIEDAQCLYYSQEALSTAEYYLEACENPAIKRTIQADILYQNARFTYYLYKLRNSDDRSLREAISFTEDAIKFIGHTTDYNRSRASKYRLFMANIQFHVCRDPFKALPYYYEAAEILNPQSKSELIRRNRIFDKLLRCYSQLLSERDDSLPIDYEKLEQDKIEILRRYEDIR